jgi:hypothetical protein
MEEAMNKSLPIVIILLLVALAVVTFFTAKSPTDEAEAVELRVYKVPQEYHNDLTSSLRYALSGSSGDNSKLEGRVASGPNGTLVITAPPKIHKGVQDFLEDLEGMEKPAAPPSPVSMTYSFIAGRTIERAALSPDRSYRIAGERKMEKLAPALKRISIAQGPMEFSLLEQIQLTSIGHDRAENRGRLASAAQRATMVAQDGIVAEVALSFGDHNHLRSQIMLEPEQILVIGQTGFANPQLEPFGRGESSKGAMLYYVVTANLDQ